MNKLWNGYYNFDGHGGLSDSLEDDEVVPPTQSPPPPVAPRERQRPGTHTIKCMQCKEPFGWAEPNQPDGVSFKCYCCRGDAYRK